MKLNIMNKAGLKALSIITLAVCMGTDNKPGAPPIKPGEVWPDNNGVHINAHGGGILKANGKYYWFGEHKTPGRKGNRAQVGVQCYSSDDLINWKDKGIALPVVENDPAHPIAKGCILERPKVVYNEKNDNYVMWFHLELLNEGYSSAMTGLAVSTEVTGPYRFEKALRPDKGVWPAGYPENLKNKQYQPDKLKPWSEEWLEAIREGMFLQRDFPKGQMSRDMTVYVDDDKKAYHIHASEENLTLHISELTDDYTDFTGIYYRVLPAGHNEAPTMFRKDKKYYMITSGCTGWDPNAARLLMADSVSGKWEYIKNPCTGPDSALTFHSQGTFILKLKENKYIFMADRWKPENPVDGRYVWLPVHFDKEGLPFLKWYDEWGISEL